MPARVFSYLRRHHIALIALFVALGGSAYAAAKLEKNSVKSKNIAAGQVKNSDLSNNAVTSPKVKDGSLMGSDIDVSSIGKVPSATAADSAQSAQVAQSAQDAGTVDGLDSTTFAPASRFVFGAADHSSTAPQTIFQAGEVTIQTDGDADTDATVGVNVGAAGSGTYDISVGSSTGVSVENSGPTASIVTYSTGRTGTLVIRQNSKPDRALQVTCANTFSPNQIQCFGLLSPAF